MATEMATPRTRGQAVRPRRRQAATGGIYWSETDQLWRGSIEAGWTDKGTRRRISLAIGQHFTQVWQKSSSEIDLERLAAELQEVRQSARSLGTGTPEEDLAVAEVANAQLAAKEGDGPRTLGHLAKAGQWILQLHSR